MTRYRRTWLVAGMTLTAVAVVGAAAAAADELVAGEWIPFDGGPEATCADGSEPLFLERPADPTRVVLYFEGGGACFDPDTCAFDGARKAYVSSSASVPGWLASHGGVFDEENPENPLAEHSFVYAPYCTGDVHLGTRTHEYTTDFVIEHKGYVNASAALEHLVTTYPDATEVVVTGASAGSVPTPLFGALVADRLPEARVVTLGDSSGAYPSEDLLDTFLGWLWGTRGAIPDWPETADLKIADWGAPMLYAYAAAHEPDVTYGRFDYAFDSTQAFYADLLGIGFDELIALVDGNEAKAEAAGAKIVSYVAPGDAHTVIADDGFYELEVEGVRFRDWFADLVSGATPEDVHCVDCAG